MKPTKRKWQAWPPIVIVRYWLHQSNRYLNPIELFHRWLLEFMFAGALYVWLVYGFNKVSAVLTAFVLAHTASAILNGHVWAMLVHDLFWVCRYERRQPFFDYIDEMRLRLEKRQPSYLAGAVFFGSLSRGEFRTTSDMDIRFIAKAGFINGFRSAHLVFQERLRALFAGFPLDAYMFQTRPEIRRKMDIDKEAPVALYSCEEQLNAVLPESRAFKEFEAVFLQGPEPDRTTDLIQARSHII